MELEPGTIVEGKYSGRKYKLLARAKEGKKEGFAAVEIEQKPFFMHDFLSYSVISEPAKAGSPTGSDTDTTGN